MSCKSWSGKCWKTKKKRSENQRLAALKKRKEAMARRIPHISEASTHSSHFVFSDDSDKNKMNLFSSSSSDEDWELGGEDRVVGAAGEKLLHLQRQIGIDKRFRLNKTFLEGEIEEEISAGDERSKCLAIVDSVLGSTHTYTKVKTSLDVVIPPRYNPLCSSHSLLEQQEKMDEKVTKEAEVTACVEQDSEPITSQEKYFAINTDLKGLFDSQGFSFLGKQIDDTLENLPDHVEVETSIDLETSVSGQNHLKATGVGVASHHWTFFNHSSELLPHSFYCSTSYSELAREWPDKRTVLKQTFRKRNKKAIRVLKMKKN